METLVKALCEVQKILYSVRYCDYVGHWKGESLRLDTGSV